MPDQTPPLPSNDADQSPKSPPTTTAIQRPKPALPGTAENTDLKKRRLPPWKVLLHNDDINDRRHVVQSLVTTTGLSAQDATLRMMEAEHHGVALVLTTHKEKAELHQQQLGCCNLTVTIEPAE